MSQYANNITQKCQKAAKAFLDAQDLTFITDAGMQIRTGISNRDMLLPSVVCQCETAAALTYEGNWSARLRVEVHSSSHDQDGNEETSDAEDEHHERASEVFSKFMDSVPNMRQHLSNQDIGFTAQHVTPVEQGNEPRDDRWVSFLVLQVECAGTYFEVS